MLWASPESGHALLGELVRYPSIADVSKPFIGLAGVRINPETNGLQTLQYYISLTLKDLNSGKETPLAIPPGARLGLPLWSPDGKHFVVPNTTADSNELLLGEVATGKIRRIPKLAINNTIGAPFSWVDASQLLIKTIRADRGKMPPPPAVPSGPVVNEAKGQSGPVRTNPDMIDNPYEEDLFDYLGTSQIVLLDVPTGRVTPIGAPGAYTSASASPDAKSILVTRLTRPYSYLHQVSAFARDIEVWDRATGKSTYKVASLPLADNVPIEGVQTGPRNVRWFPTEPNTIVWTEALDGGNGRKPAEFRDRIMRFRAPFNKGEAVEVARTASRVMSWQALEGSTQAFVTESDRAKRWTRTLMVDFAKPGTQPKEIWSRGVADRYRDPGRPIGIGPAPGGFGQSAPLIRQKDGIIWLEGQGASPKGDKPFLDRFSIATLKSERVYQSSDSEFEDFVSFASADGSKYITRRESPGEPPNYFLRVAGKTEAIPITNFKDPVSQLRKIKKQLVRYKRADGVDLQFTLYLPPDYKPGTRLPTILYAYPSEFVDSDTAGQVAGSTEKFTAITGYSHLFCVLAGYAVLDNASMPVVGDSETVNNTYVEQITASAKAAIDKAAEMGVTDPNRVGVIGHSYGAFMTANLLAHTDLFRAGVARSGAYNRTLTPFGFQNELRTYWQATETYMKMSPFNYAQKINEPILFIHGQADDNQGTFTVQSERMYQAVRGNGGTARLVLLPHEAHGYRAKESVEHTLYETISWFDKYVKNAQPPSVAPSGTN